jgi:hypothetical protein
MKLYGIFYSYHYIGVYTSPESVLRDINEYVETSELDESEKRKFPTVAELESMDVHSDIRIEFDDTSWCTIQAISESLTGQIIRAVDARFTDHEHSFVDSDNEGSYGHQVCRICGIKEKK